MSKLLESMFQSMGRMMGTGIPSDPKKSAKQFAKTDGKKGFNFGLYVKAVGVFFNDFFGKKISYFFSNLGTVFSDLPRWWGKQEQDEKAAYGFLLVGNIMFVVGIVLIILI